MRKLSFAKICLLLAMSLGWLGFAVVGKTWASFLDTETSSGNTFTAATLDFSWTSPGDFSPSVTPKQSSSRDITINKIGNLDFQYNGSVVKTGGNSAVCDALHLEAKLEGATKHDDGLLGFNITPKVIIGGDGQDVWTFIVTLISIDPSLEGQTCDFNIVFNAEQLDSPGFSDQEVVPSIITVGSSTVQGDFESGVLAGVDTTTSPGDVMLTGAYSLDNNTVALWHLNEGAGTTAFDETINNNDGTINGAVWTVGKYNNALSFNGTDDKVGVPDSSSLDLTSQMTVEAWILADTWNNPDAPYNVINIIDKGEHKTSKAFGLYSYQGNLHFRLNKNANADVSATLPSTGTWHHVAGTYDGSKVKLYIDGVKVAEKNYTGGILTNNEPLYIGTAVERDYWFDGVIDEVRISDIARTSFPVSYFNSGTLESQSFDGGEMTRWQSLEWDETLPSANTDITLEVATSNDDSTWSPWQLSSSTSPIDLTGLPETRYIKWEATLTTTDTSQTPILHEVRVKYYPGAASEHIVLNEFLPNPSGTNPDYEFDFGEDGDSQPKGEWIEIYNKEGGSAVDLAGWYIKDKDGNTKFITASNTDTGSTVIGANGSGNEWLVVYMNEEMLDNNEDAIELYDVFDNLVDSYSYDLSGFCALEPTSGDSNDKTASGDCPSEIPGNKSYARIPDGSADWVDPVPTPGEPNRVEESNSDEATLIYPVINEVYYNVGEDKGSDSGNEWVEIYNKSDQPLDISGWKICDDESCNTLPTSEPIPADGFAIITADAATWDFWPSIPAEVVKILLDSDIGNGLSNEGDKVVLQKPDGTEIDVVSFGVDDYAFSPSCPNVAKGYSLARGSKGEDTNQASDFIELSTPSPGEDSSSPEDEEEVDEVLIVNQEGLEDVKEAVESDETEIETETEIEGEGEMKEVEEEEVVEEKTETETEMEEEEKEIKTETEGEKKENQEGKEEQTVISPEVIPPEVGEELLVEEDGEKGDDFEGGPQSEPQSEEQTQKENPEEGVEKSDE